MDISRTQFRFFLLPVLGLGLLCLGLFLAQPFVAGEWDCEVQFELSARKKYLQQIESNFKKDIYFWSWINHEGFGSKELNLPTPSSCTDSAGHKSSSWLKVKIWSTLYPMSYQHFQQSLALIDDANKSVFVKIKDFQNRRPDWWEPLQMDLKKICSLSRQVKRLSEVKSQLLSNCRVPAAVNAVNPCLKEIKSMEKLIQREEKPLNENREKMKSKWPYLEKIIDNEDLNCDAL